MKNILIFIIVLLFSVLFGGLALSAENLSFKFPIKKMYAEPTTEAEVVFEIPIEVKAIGISPDLNWFKIKISYDLSILGHYEYVGWCYAPLGDVIMGRQKGETPAPESPPELPF
ncbi:MAG: hypothetical protein NT030_05350 [Candidatus Saganbacteria bacterium]|nr:hypothetical protein [Candidatus Saganbacteria bacterium]